MSEPVTRLGLQIPYFNFEGTPPERLLDRLTEIATTAERSGFDSIWVMDHLIQIPSVGAQELWMLEGNMALMAIAARTSALKLGLMVGGVTYRNPALHAKMTTTLDVLSGGRAIHGIGAAWFDAEHEQYGFRYPPIAERFERLEDHLNIARAMFTQERPSYEGRHHSISGVLNNPRPIRGDVPIMVGGGGERKTLRLVARYADASNVFGDAAQVRHKVSVLEGHCEAVGRDPAEITKTRLGTLIVADTHEAAQRKLANLRPGLDAVRLGAWVGGPDEIAEQARAHLDAGLDGLIFNLSDVEDLESVELAGRVLREAV
ncbi:MAG TPA: TIGR03560 family F420-dependent LLM class oxidoreductase [Solirubrobacteraceae bacterium]|nr:TIGR03560 family F420-dependent LLM class oxidoreductase [Solirubrobacteraceae bacterium]